MISQSYKHQVYHTHYPSHLPAALITYPHLMHSPNLQLLLHRVSHGDIHSKLQEMWHAKVPVMIPASEKSSETYPSEKKINNEQISICLHCYFHPQNILIGRSNVLSHLRCKFNKWLQFSNYTFMTSKTPTNINTLIYLGNTAWENG